MNWTKIRNEIEAELKREKDKENTKIHRNNMRELNIDIIN